MDRSTLDTRLDQAAEHYAQGRHEEALAIYQAALEEDPTNPDALNDAGLCHYQLGAPQESIACFEQALEHDPSYEGAFFNLLEVLAQQPGGDLRATEVFNQQTAIPSSSEKAHHESALFHVHLKQAKDALPAPIAIGGCGSSGTTLLRRIIDAHPDIACGKEMSVFDRPAMYRISIEELKVMHAQERYAPLEADILYPIRSTLGTYFGLAPGRHGDSYHTREEVTLIFEHAHSIAQFWNLYFATYARKQGKPRWAEKTPNNIFCAADFLEMYPDGHFIQVLRDGRDVCLSLMKRREYKPHQACTRWIMSVEAGLHVANHDRVGTVRYENLVNDPEGTLRRLFAELGITYAPQVLRFAEKESDNHHGYGEQPIFSSSAGRWEDEWSELPSSTQRGLELALRRHLAATEYISVRPQATLGVLAKA